MMSVINNQNVKPSRGKIPLWFMILFSAVSLFFLSTVGLYAYQEYNRKSLDLLQESELYIQKLGVLQQDDVIDVNWLHTLNPLVKKVKGRLLWSSEKQYGFMEFINLPVLEKSQRYRLWIYDLYSNRKAVSAIIDPSKIFKHKVRIVMPFKAAATIESPFKFELMLEESGKEEQPLLLAQP